MADNVGGFFQGSSVAIGNEGYWGPVSSSVDWCEMNYVKSHYIAEFWNSFSSFAMVTAGFLGVFLNYKVSERRFKIAFSMVCVLGIGSVLFHGSLLHWTQMCDEVPMLYAAMSTMFILLELNDCEPKRKWLAPMLTLHCCMCTLLVALTSGMVQFVLFHLSFGSAEFFSLYQVYLVYKKYTHVSVVRKLFWSGMISYCTGIFAWQLDLQNCYFVQVTWPSLTGLPNPQLHAWWHVFVSVGFYQLITLILLCRQLVLVKEGVVTGKPTVRYAMGFVPFVALEKDGTKQS